MSNEHLIALCEYRGTYHPVLRLLQIDALRSRMGTLTRSIAFLVSIGHPKF